MANPSGAEELDLPIDAAIPVAVHPHGDAAALLEEALGTEIS